MRHLFLSFLSGLVALFMATTSSAGLLTYKMIFYLDNGTEIGHGTFAYDPKNKEDLYLVKDDDGMATDERCYIFDPDYCIFFDTWTKLSDLTVEIFGEYLDSEFSLWVEGTYANYHGSGSFEGGWRLWNYSDGYVLDFGPPYSGAPALVPAFYYNPLIEFGDTIYVAWFQTPLPAAFISFVLGCAGLIGFRKVALASSRRS